MTWLVDLQIAERVKYLVGNERSENLRKLPPKKSLMLNLQRPKNFNKINQLPTSNLQHEVLTFVSNLQKTKSSALDTILVLETNGY
jgi:hypothetical protein